MRLEGREPSTLTCSDRRPAQICDPRMKPRSERSDADGKAVMAAESRVATEQTRRLQTSLAPRWAGPQSAKKGD